MEIDTRYMKRAIELARHAGLANTSPNPMVGAVIVRDGMIIGEGYHRRCGEGHAEVNAIASVSDPELLKDSTIYVTLEPCSHYGKTPPCSQLIIDKGIPRVVVGSLDPYEKVSGRGVKMLRDAGIEVTTGVLEEECRAVNPVFMTAHSLRRPWVTLKWAQSADGYIDRLRDPSQPPAQLSTPLTATLMHRQRTMHDAIMAGSSTVISDNPSLTPRLWPGRNPKRVIMSRHNSIPADCRLLTDGLPVTVSRSGSVAEELERLYAEGTTSVLVEGGAKLLQSFIDAGLWDMMRVETSPLTLGEGVKAPKVDKIPSQSLTIDNNRIDYFVRDGLLGVKNL